MVMMVLTHDTHNVGQYPRYELLLTFLRANERDQLELLPLVIATPTIKFFNDGTATHEDLYVACIIECADHAYSKTISVRMPSDKDQTKGRSDAFEIRKLTHHAQRKSILHKKYIRRPYFHEYFLHQSMDV